MNERSIPLLVYIGKNNRAALGMMCEILVFLCTLIVLQNKNALI